jgi:vitamin K-dependent gamma-carboxylase
VLAPLRAALTAPVDPAGLIVFRVGFGLLAAFSALRVMALGWVEALYVTPITHFPWISGLTTPPSTVLYGLFWVQVLAGLGVAVGVFPRVFLTLWLLSFGYVELLDKTLYLNHYVLFTLLGLWTLLAPLGRLTLTGGAPLPAWNLYLLRAQVATVYLWAGVAKLNADWLSRGEPLKTWLEARAQLPVLGPLIAHDTTALGMSWAGAAYDLAVPWLLLHPRTRALGVVLVVGFHSAVGLLFPIGVFPALMILSSTLLWSPSWPRRWLGSNATPSPAPPPWPWPQTAAFFAVITLMTLFPGRGLLRGEDVAWTERGHRLAWRVMLIEKTGLVEYRVVEAKTGRVWRVSPAEELTALQHKQLRTQPDLIRDYALQLKAQHAAEGREVAVYAEAWASLNGRPAQRLLSAELDLTQSLGALEEAGWILPRDTP